MKRIALLVFMLLTASCRPRATATESSPGAVAPASNVVGASTPRAALEAFLAGVRAQDLQAMSAVWGTKDGPAREKVSRQYIEKQTFVMQCYFSHDRYRVMNETQGLEGRRVIRVSLTKGNLTRETTFTIIEGPSRRWYVEEADIMAVRDFCRQPPGA